MIKKEQTFAGILAIIAAAIISIVIYLAGVPTTEVITGYESCVAAGGQILESFPERCITSDGRSFTRSIP